MLNGIDPIIIFNLKKLVPPSGIEALKPLVEQKKQYVTLPPIPIYLSETLTGLYIDTEDKSIEITTTVESKSEGGTNEVNQKSFGSTIKINLKASRDSIGVTLLSALCDFLFDKTTSKEYSITYLHGAITLFGGLLHTFNITQSADNTLYDISIELQKGEDTTKPAVEVPVIQRTTGVTPSAVA